MAVHVHERSVKRIVTGLTVFSLIALVFYMKLYYYQPLQSFFKTQLFRKADDRPMYIPALTGRAHQLGTS